MIKFLKAVFTRLRSWLSRENCYKQMEAQGIAVFGMCSGLVGGDKSTECLQYACYGCKYYTPAPTCKGCVYESDDCIYQPACGVDKSLYIPKD